MNKVNRFKISYRSNISGMVVRERINSKNNLEKFIADWQKENSKDELMSIQIL